nr:reverse transcriptase domain-containing protein [Tanacetum cinerariifolium]
MHAYYAKESPIPPPVIVPPSPMLSPMFNPQEFFCPEELLPIKKRGRDRMPPKRTSTSTTPAITQAGIRQLVADSVTVALEAQATTMASIDNLNRNTRPRENPVEKRGNYKEIISCQPFYFNAPVARAPYRLAPSEMQELSNQLQELADRGLHVDPDKIKAIKNWASPTKSTKLRQFLGLADYYRRFIKNFSTIAKSLTELTQKNKKYIWGEDQETAFQLLKQKLCEAPILALPEGNNDFVVYCVASHQGLGAVLMQSYHHKSSKPKLRQLKKKYQSRELTRNGQSIEMDKAFEIRPDGTRCIKNQKFSYNNSYHASIKATPFEALYGQKCRSLFCWAKVGDVQLTGPEIIPETTEKIVQIRQCLQAARDRQRSYANVRRKPLEFQIGDRAMLKVSPRKELWLDEKLNFVEEPMEIMDRDVKQLRPSRIPIVKVRWNSKRGPEFTWKREDEIRAEYPHLFSNITTKSD